MWCARRANVPYFVRPLGVLNRYGRTRRRPLLKRMSLLAIELPLLRSAAGLHFTGEREQIETNELGINVPAFVIPLGIDVSVYDDAASGEVFFARWPQSRDRRLILFISRLDPVKGLEELLTAFASVHKLQPETMLVIGGSGHADYTESLRRLSRELGVDSDVIWTGFLDNSEKRAAFAAAEIFVQPSYSESFGLSAAEALVAGCAAILSAGVSFARRAAAAEAAMVVPPDSKSIAEAMKKLLLDPKLRKRLRRNARHFATSSLSLEETGELLEQMYRSIVQK